MYGPYAPLDRECSITLLVMPRPCTEFPPRPGRLCRSESPRREGGDRDDLTRLSPRFLFQALGGVGGYCRHPVLAFSRKEKAEMF